MTLVAATLVRDVPVLITDILLSAHLPHREAAHAPLPTTPATVLEKAFFGAWKHMHFDLSRKAVVLNEQFVLGYSGDWIAARSLLTELVADLKSGPASLLDLEWYLSRKRLPGKQRCHLVGWHAGNDNKVAFRWDSQAPHQLETGDRFVIGSGADAFESLAADPGRPFGSTNPAAAGQTTAVFEALSMTTALLGSEMGGGETLARRFGAGFEVHYFDGARFVAVDSATYFLWCPRIDPGAKFAWPKQPSRVVKYWYDGQNVMCQATQPALGKRVPAGLKASQLDYVRIGQTDIHAARPIHVHTEVSPVSEAAPYSAEFYCHVILARVNVVGGGTRTVSGSLVLPRDNVDLFRCTRQREPGGDVLDVIGVHRNFLKNLYDRVGSSAVEASAVADPLFSDPDPIAVAKLRRERPQLGVLLKAWGNRLAEERRPEAMRSADQKLAAALLLCPGDAHILRDRAVNLAELGIALQPPETEECFERSNAAFLEALTAEPDLEGLRRDVSWMLVNRASVSLERTIAATSEGAEHLLLDAAEYLKRAFSFDPDPLWGDVWCRCAWGCLRVSSLEGHDARALLDTSGALAEMALKLRAGHASASVVLGLTRIEQGKLSVAGSASFFDEARTLLLRATEELPAVAFHSLAVLACAERDENSCRDYLQKSMAHDVPDGFQLSLDEGDFEFVRTKPWFVQLMNVTPARR